MPRGWTPRGGPQSKRRSQPWRRLEPSSAWTCTPSRSWRRCSTSKIPRASGERVKTDRRRDAEHLVRLLLAGDLHPVRVPGGEEEALRDFVRAREAVRVDLMRCRHRLSKLLLRRGIRFEDGRAWTKRHRVWLAAVDLGHDAAQATLIDQVGAVDALCHRRDQLEREILARLGD